MCNIVENLLNVYVSCFPHRKTMHVGAHTKDLPCDLGTRLVRKEAVTSGRFQWRTRLGLVSLQSAGNCWKVLAYATDWCHCLPGTIHRTRAVCSVHHVAATNMEPTELRIGEKVVYLVNEAESVWDLLHFHRGQLMLWLCSVKGWPIWSSTHLRLIWRRRWRDDIQASCSLSEK